MYLQLTLETTAYTREQLRFPDLPQIALAGRSNVGKSSLINSLAGQKNLARTSSTPGKTRSINFFQAAQKNFYLVDLPGYGYARCSKMEREKWSRLIQEYLQDNLHLAGVVLLLDSRIDPQSSDLDLAHYVESLQTGLLPVLTKADKCNQKQRQLALKRWQKLLERAYKPILFSARTRQGQPALLEAMQKLVQAHSPPVHPENLQQA
ncbi:ribosome biogenesis GTP-binding protein YihA/YsxC [Desulfonatronospira sp.]|uniref:ribosome biogenesis GTP-binding protein YihA/YsxC n=1 Tax=Desulfonatronospira sp. TaxID=1962951 RepID=UPI0025B98887|nr:ribosome biogenesis GTP-binding protein YihA/YsxC [Desulfonatronospira sp.]